VYSYGVLLYELFCGDVPFDDADPREILKAHVTQAPPPLSVHRPDLPDGLVLLVADMLQKDPENRPWMVEVASRLARIRSAMDPQEDAPSALGRREIAVLCASLEGLRPDEQEPAQVAAALEAFLAGAAEIVNGLGGRVDATVGERVFAVFGYPREDAQAAVHAVRAAVQLHRRLVRLALPGLAVWAGVAAGQALVGQVRGDPTDATVLGAPLWRAARLVDDGSAVEPLLVDEPALELVRGLVDVGKRRSRRDIGRYYPVTLRD
jgi:class 3 adenylate cyclase